MTAADDRSAPLAMDDLRELLPDFRRHLKAKNRAENTINSYSQVAEDFISYLIEKHLPTVAPDITDKHLEAFLADMRDRPHKRTGKPLSSAYIAKYFRSLQQFFRWLYEVEDVGDGKANPFGKLSPPAVPDQPTAVLSEKQLKALLDTTKGKTFENLRDRALMLLFIDTPARLGEIAGLRVENREADEPSDFDFEADVIHVMGKGRRPRAMPMSPATAEAVRRYLRARARHKAAATTRSAWLGRKGALTDWGIRHVINRRADDAGVPHVHPHMFRHTFSHRWLAEGGQEQDLMRLAGWRSREMLARYGASAADERARKAHRNANLIDRIT